MSANKNDAFDIHTGAQAVIQEPHLNLHRGFMFMLDDRFSGIATGTNRDYLITVPTLIFPHMRVAEFSVDDGPCDVLLYEGPTTTANGTEVFAVNNNRNSDKVSTVQFYHTPTVSATGDQVYDEYLPAAGPVRGGGQTQDPSEEWILKQGTNYLLRLTNNSGGAIDGGLHLAFYDLKAAAP